MTYTGALTDDWKVRRSRSADWAWRLSSFSLPLLIMGLAAHRWGYADTIAALAVFGVAFLFAAMGVVLSLAAFIGIWNKGGRGVSRAVSALIVGAIVSAIPLAAGIQIGRLPLINDITTDPDAITEFEVLAAPRTAVGAPSVYGEGDFFLQQIEAYPLVVPVRFENEFDAVLNVVLAEVGRSGWRVVATRISEDTAPREAFIEAVATTPVFAFKDDIAIRLTETGEVVRLDMRSASRVGEHDLGANARRIVRFLEGVEEAVRESERV